MMKHPMTFPEEENRQIYSVINDAVHGVMCFPNKYKVLLKNLIDSETFQRLRHIKQLGMTDLIFPTAVHNRFSHCLGAAYVAYMMSDKLNLNEDEKKYAVIGALLHDIGHGPFSHAFEKFLKNAIDYRLGNVAKEKFIQENFCYYKTLTDYDIWMLIRDFAVRESNVWDDPAKIARRIYQRKIHHNFSFEETSLGAMSSIVDNLKKELVLADWEIFITESDTTAYESEEDPILIIDESKSVHRIQKHSYLLNILGDKREKEAYLAVDLDLWESRKNHLKNKFKNYITFMEQERQP